jgi:hypothetical protein
MNTIRRHVAIGSGPVTDEDVLGLRQIPGPDMTFEVTREAQPGRTLSKEAVDNLTIMMRSWVLSRLFSSLEAIPGAHGGHSKVRVTVHVEVE